MTMISKLLYLGLSATTFGCLVGETAPGHLDPNILGGTQDSGDGSVVQIRFATAGAGGLGESACTGTVISSGALLTAAHCAGGFKYEYNPSRSADPFSATSTGWIAASYAIANPAYNGDPKQGHDVAIVGLSSPTSITPSALGGAPAVGSSVRAVGYGLTQPGTSGPSGTKFEKTFPVLSLAAHEFVAGPEDTCHGDSGGPVFDANNSVVGTTSYGDTSDCHGNDHFMLVSDNRAWIDATVAQFGGGGGGGSGGGSGSGSGGGSSSSSCDASQSINGQSVEVSCNNGACECYQNGSLVNACVENASGCSIPGSCCGF